MISNYSLAADEDLKGRSGRSSSAASRTSFKTTTTAIEPEEVVEENGEKVDEPVQEPVSEAVQDLETMADEIELTKTNIAARITRCLDSHRPISLTVSSSPRLHIVVC